MCIFAIGDVHGRLDLLTRMHEGIAEHLDGRPVDDWRIIHLGDYTDRGPQSRGVLDFLIAATKRDPRVICLAGNHDVGLLDFLAEPDPNGLFANNGGRQTALSYGVDLNFMNPVAFGSQYEAFRRAVPEAHRAFIERLPFSIEFGDFFFCHAGIMPGVALADQEPRDLIWIRDRFLDHTELYAKVIVHGHTPAAQAEVRANRVNVDTGAYASGVLTALAIESDDKQLMQVVAG